MLIHGCVSRMVSHSVQPSPYQPVDYLGGCEPLHLHPHDQAVTFQRSQRRDRDGGNQRQSGRCVRGLCPTMSSFQSKVNQGVPIALGGRPGSSGCHSAPWFGGNRTNQDQGSPRRCRPHLKGVKQVVLDFGPQRLPSSSKAFLRTVTGWAV